MCQIWWKKYATIPQIYSFPRGLLFCTPFMIHMKILKNVIDTQQLAGSQLSMPHWNSVSVCVLFNQHSQRQLCTPDQRNWLLAMLYTGIKLPMQNTSQVGGYSKVQTNLAACWAGCISVWWTSEHVTALGWLELSPTKATLCWRWQHCQNQWFSCSEAQL